MTAPRVLVTDAGRGSALAVIRSLGRQGWHVVAADTRPVTVGAVSRYAAASATYPSPFDGPAADTAGAVLELARRHTVDLVVPVTDDVVLPLDLRRDETPDGCTLAIADGPALATAADKAATMAMAREVGVAAPDTEVVCAPAQAAGLVGRFGAPVVVKPSRSRVLGADGRLHKSEVSYAWDERQLAAAVASAGQPVLVQAYCPGDGHGIGMVLDHGRPVLAVQHRRLHEVPVTGGASALRETVALDPDLYRSAADLLGALSWTGAAMVEFKVGAAGAKLMEVNGRLWGSLPLAVHSGADVPGRLAAVHLGRHDRMAAPDTSYRIGERSRNLDLELVWIMSTLRGRAQSPPLHRPRRWEGVVAAGQLVRGGQRDDILSRDDPRPGVTGVRHAVAHITRKVRHGR